MYKFFSLLFSIEVLIFSWNSRKSSSIFFKTRFSVLPPVTCWRVVVFCVFNKERKAFVVKENSGVHKRELLKYHESFPILVFWGEPANENSIIIISKGNHCVVDLGIACNFYISIDPVYPRCCARISLVVGELRGIRVFLLHRSSSPLSTMSFNRA